MVMDGIDCCELGPGETPSVLGVDGYSERVNKFRRGEALTEEGFRAFLDARIWGGDGRVKQKENLTSSGCALFT